MNWIIVVVAAVWLYTTGVIAMAGVVFGMVTQAGGFDEMVAENAQQFTMSNDDIADPGVIRHRVVMLCAFWPGFLYRWQQDHRRMKAEWKGMDW